LWGIWNAAVKVCPIYPLHVLCTSDTSRLDSDQVSWDCGQRPMTLVLCDGDTFPTWSMYKCCSYLLQYLEVGSSRFQSVGTCIWFQVINLPQYRHVRMGGCRMNLVHASSS
jgi:hypothetical protein